MKSILTKALEAGDTLSPRHEAQWLKIRPIGVMALKELRAAGLVQVSESEIEFDGFAPKLTRIIFGSFIKTKDQLREEIANKSFRPGRVRSMGWGSYREICSKLGVEPAAKMVFVEEAKSPKATRQKIDAKIAELNQVIAEDAKPLEYMALAEEFIGYLKLLRP